MSIFSIIVDGITPQYEEEKKDGRERRQFLAQKKEAETDFAQEGRMCEPTFSSYHMLVN